MINGYRYSAVGTDVYYIHLLCNNEKQCTDGYYTTDCVVERITNANTGETVKEINGRAYYHFTYKEGQHITGTRIYYCHSIQELFDFYHITEINGKVRPPRVTDSLEHYKISQGVIIQQFKKRMAKVRNDRNEYLETLERLRQERAKKMAKCREELNKLKAERTGTK